MDRFVVFRPGNSTNVSYFECHCVAPSTFTNKRSNLLAISLRCCATPVARRQRVICFLHMDGWPTRPRERANAIRWHMMPLPSNYPLQLTKCTARIFLHSIQLEDYEYSGKRCLAIVPIIRVVRSIDRAGSEDIPECKAPRIGTKARRYVVLRIDQEVSQADRANNIVLRGDVDVSSRYRRSKEFPPVEPAVTVGCARAMPACCLRNKRVSVALS